MDPNESDPKYQKLWLAVYLQSELSKTIYKKIKFCHLLDVAGCLLTEIFTETI